MQKLFLLAAVAVLASVGSASAAGGCANCPPKPYGPFGHNTSGKPAFQAAPWYLYWPYNAHFQTPAPMMGAYYAPPSAGGMMTSPYFPAQPGYGR